MFLRQMKDPSGPFRMYDTRERRMEKMGQEEIDMGLMNASRIGKKVRCFVLRKVLKKKKKKKKIFYDVDDFG